MLYSSCDLRDEALVEYYLKVSRGTVPRKEKWIDWSVNFRRSKYVHQRKLEMPADLAFLTSHSTFDVQPMVCLFGPVVRLDIILDPGLSEEVRVRE